MDSGPFSGSADELRSIPLADLLTWHGLEPKPEGASFRAKTDRHNIVATGSKWFDNAAGIGGFGAIDLRMHLAGEAFSEACLTLTNHFRAGLVARSGIEFPPRTTANSERIPFQELMARYAARDDRNWSIARAYLVERRNIEPAIVDELHGAGSIYANDHHPNPALVFLHQTIGGKIVGATLRGTRHESPFRPSLGDKLTGWFSVGSVQEARDIVAVESPIDALSYCTLFSHRNDGLAVVSCSGSTIPHELMAHAYERRQSFVGALDNDAAGERGWQRAWDQTADWTGFKISSECPRLKDWNADLAASVQAHPATLTEKLSL